MSKKSILMIHYGVYTKDRWGRTFPLAVALVRIGYQVTLLTNSGRRNLFRPDCFLERGVKIVAVGDIVPESFTGRGYGFFSFLRRIFFCLRNRFDFVYTDCSETPNAGWPAKIEQIFHNSLYLSEWGDLLGKGGHYDRKSCWFKLFYGWYYLWAEFYFRRSADIVIVLSSMMKKYAESLDIPAKKVIVIPGGASYEIFASLPKLSSKGSNEKINLGYIGMDNGEIRDLLPLIKVLQRTEYEESFSFTVFGHFLSPEIRDKYKLGQTIQEKGWVNYYKDISPIEDIDVFVLMKTDNITRSAAGWPNKLGDYLAMGRPVMLTPYGDITSFVAENPEGFILVDGGSEDIARQLDKIKNRDYDLCAMGQINRNVAQQKISWVARTEKLMDFVKEKNDVG